MTWQEIRESIEQLPTGDKLRLIREISELVQQDLRPTEPPGGADPVERLIGSVEGPGDLAARHDAYVYGAG